MTMSFSMNKLKAILPGSHLNGAGSSAAKQNESIEPEIGFSISIEAAESTQNSNLPNAAKTLSPELVVNLMTARHLPTLFGFKIVQGYLIKVKMFPGTKRLDSTIQTNSWPKFNETFRFPLAPDIKSSMKHSSRRGSKATAVSEFTPEELFAGQFVVFTVYALLELPPTSFNRFSKTYRSLKDKGSNLVQNIFDGTTNDTNGNATNDNKENSAASKEQQDKRKKRMSMDSHNTKEAMPVLTISESRRNIGSVTCYLEPKIFKRNSRGIYATEELWLPIKDITTTVSKSPANNNNSLANSPKGMVELVLEVIDVGEPMDPTNDGTSTNGSMASINTTSGSIQHRSWNQRMTSEMKRKMGMRNVSSKKPHQLALKVTTARMRCSNKAKDELEATAGSVYVKSTVFQHGIYIDSWKSGNFYPSLSTKWDMGCNDPATITIPMDNIENLDNIYIRTTLATKTKMAKKLVLGTVLIGGQAASLTISGSGAEHMQLLKETPMHEKVSMWHCYT